MFIVKTKNGEETKPKQKQYKGTLRHHVSALLSLTSWLKQQDLCRESCINNFKGSVIHEKKFMEVLLYETLLSTRWDLEVWLGKFKWKYKDAVGEMELHTGNLEIFCLPCLTQDSLMRKMIRETSEGVTGWNGERGWIQEEKWSWEALCSTRKQGRRRELQGRNKGKLSPFIGRAGGRSQEELPRGDETEHETHVYKQLCRWLQLRWEISIIFGYLTRYILKMMSGRLELWNRKVSHFLATRTQAVNTPLFTITADGSHSTHS